MVLVFSVCTKKVDLKKRSVSLSFNFDTMPALFGLTDEVLPGVFELFMSFGLFAECSVPIAAYSRGVGEERGYLFTGFFAEVFVPRGTDFDITVGSERVDEKRDCDMIPDFATYGDGDAVGENKKFVDGRAYGLCGFSDGFPISIVELETAVACGTEYRMYRADEAGAVFKRKQAYLQFAPFGQGEEQQAVGKLGDPAFSTGFIGCGDVLPSSPLGDHIAPLRFVQQGLQFIGHTDELFDNGLCCAAHDRAEGEE